MAPRYTPTTSHQEYLRSTNILHLLTLENSSSVCCVGCTAKNKRCSKVIAKKNYDAAKVIIKKLKAQSLDKDQGYLLILNLARLTLCPGYHRDQAKTVSKRWLDENDWGFTSDLRTKGEDDNTHSRQTPEEDRDSKVRKAAEKARREEALRQAQRDKSERASNAERQRSQHEADTRAKAEEAARERLRRERAEKAEKERRRREQEKKDRLKREEDARKQRQRNESVSWEGAWDRYEKAYGKLVNSNGQPTNREIETLCFWPTRAGLYSSCNEAAVKEFFAHRPQNLDRKALRRQAVRWYPDRTTRLFVHAQDQATVQRMVTMVTQVITGVMELYAG
jgi:flagellar biosynthesis GTPase FlhF